MKPINRVAEIIRHHEMSISAFEKRIGMSNNSIQTALKRNANLKDDTLNNILKSFPEISAVWLLTGEGTMFKSPENVTGEEKLAYESSGNEQYIIELQKEYIGKLKEEIQHLKQKL